MKNYIVFFLVVVLALFFGVVAWENRAPEKPAGDHKNISYNIDGKNVALVNGLSETESASGSASKITTRYFGNEAKGDLNGDGSDDIVFLLTQDTGGSGTFYYAVVALKTDSGYTGGNAVLLGDRIAPQTTEVKNGFVVVNYTDRNASEPMTSRPSVGVSKYLEMKNGKLTETPIFIREPLSGSAISSPIKVSGLARGNWYFEASFPAVITDKDGKTLGTGIATAEGEWMTTNYVPFSGEVKFTGQKSGEKGYLIFKKDNPSGLPEHEDSRQIEITFK